MCISIFSDIKSKSAQGTRNMRTIKIQQMNKDRRVVVTGMLQKSQNGKGRNKDTAAPKGTYVVG